MRVLGLFLPLINERGLIPGHVGSAEPGHTSTSPRVSIGGVALAIADPLESIGPETRKAWRLNSVVMPSLAQSVKDRLSSIRVDHAHRQKKATTGILQAWVAG
jgi:hypothetical protein